MFNLLDFFASTFDTINYLLGFAYNTNEEIIRKIRVFIKAYGESEIFKRVFKDSGAFKKMYELFGDGQDFENYIESSSISQLIDFLESFSKKYPVKRDCRNLTQLFAKHFANCSEKQEYVEKVIIYNEAQGIENALIFDNSETVLENSDELEDIISDSEIIEQLLDDIEYAGYERNFCMVCCIDEDIDDD